MSKLSLSKNKSRKKVECTPALSNNQKTLTSYFSRTVTLSSIDVDEGDKCNADKNKVDATEVKENIVEKLSSASAMRPTAEKVALKEKSNPQIEVDLKSPVKKKQKVSCSGDAAVEVKDVAATCRKISLEPESCEKSDAGIDGNALEMSDFGNWSDYEFDDDNIQKMDSRDSYEQIDLSKIQRCIVKKVCQNNDGSKQIEVSLFGNSNSRASCSVKDSWCWESSLCEGSIVNIKACKTLENQWQVYNDPDDLSLLVEEPDTLLSCTTVMSALRCRRAAVFSEIFKGLGMQDSGGYLALGKLMHEVTQQSLDQKLQGWDNVAAVFDSLLKTPRIIYDLYTMNNDLSKLKEAAKPYFSTVSRFLELYAKEGDGFNKELISEASKQGSDAWPGKIDQVVDIEDTLWMPQFGLKGKLDLTSTVRKSNNPYKKLLVPLELKTGKTDTDQVAHRGQLMLYIAMLSEVEQQKIDYGLLIYLKTCAVKEVRANKGEIRDAIILRNELAKSVKNVPEVLCTEEEKKISKPPTLPEPINRPRECSRCPYLEVCTAYSTKENYHSPVQSDRLKERRGNLSMEHIDYFIHWTCLSQIEEQNSSNSMTNLWTKTPQMREVEKLTCLCDLEVMSCHKDGSQFRTVLERSKESKHMGALEAAGFNAGDFIVFGNQKRLVLGLGTISSISASSIVLILDKDFSLIFGAKNYSLDLYRSNRMLTSKMVALANLLADSDEAYKLRQLIIDKLEPDFASSNAMRYVDKVMPEVVKNLNAEQRECVQKVLEAKDYVLVRGLPGSGKTATIVSLVRMLNALGFSVLVTSHTNSAVDNVICKLVPYNLNLLRLGASSKVASALKEFTEEALMSTATSMEHLDELMKLKTVVGVTCTSATHPLLRRKRFDYCIVDEATQVPQPSTIPALLCARVFILVGDPDQLQPVVSNKVAQELGMQETLFERLYRPENTAVLGLQYRMNARICELANKLTYNGALKCGTQEVADSKFILPNNQVLSTAPEWVQIVLGERNGVVFVDTGCTRAKKDDVDDVSNETEAQIITKLVDTIVKGGVNPKDIGVMTPFRRQVSVISCKITDPQIDVSTVDQFQGKDKLVCLVSFVKSFEQREDEMQRGGILNDTKRLTVAITRARVKLILVGDLESLQNYEPLRRLKAAMTDSIVTLGEVNA